jgi:hypothetical protein
MENILRWQTINIATSGTLIILYKVTIKNVDDAYLPLSVWQV